MLREKWILMQMGGAYERGIKKRLELASKRLADGRGPAHEVLVIADPTVGDHLRIAKDVQYAIQQSKARARDKVELFEIARRSKPDAHDVGQLVERLLETDGLRLKLEQYRQNESRHPFRIVLSTQSGSLAHWCALLEFLELVGVPTALLHLDADGKPVVSSLGTEGPESGSSGVPSDMRGQLDYYGTLPASATVLLTGPTGTGKTELGRELHARWSPEKSARKWETFRAVNCAAIPHDLIESELFGYEKGAFTGAEAQSPGIFGAFPSHGTILLDEIGELPLSAQAKLLTALDSDRDGQPGVRKFYRVGGTKPYECRARILFATNRDLPNDVRNGRFREDLLARIGTHQVRLQPLRSARHRAFGIYARRFHDLRRQYAGDFQFDFDGRARARLIEFVLSTEAPWTRNYRDVVQSASRLAHAAFDADRKRKAKRKAKPKKKASKERAARTPGLATITIDLDMVETEIGKLWQEWNDMDPGLAMPDADTWKAVRAAMSPAEFDRKTRLEQFEAVCVWQAGREAKSAAEAWRILQERRLIPAEAVTNQSDSFHKKWKACFGTRFTPAGKASPTTRRARSRTGRR